MLIISGLLATFPSLAMGYSYLFMTEIYMTALLLSVVGVYITTKTKWGFVIGGIIISFCLGNYQSYIGVASGLAIIYLIKITLDGCERKEIITNFIKLFLMGIIGTVVYFIILNIFYWNC